MKNLNNITTGVLAIAIVALFFLFLSDIRIKNNKKEKNLIEKVDHQPVVYIDTDSLLINYNFAIDLNEQLFRKAENSRADLNQKKLQVQTAMSEFKKKFENNAFLTQERTEQERRNIIKMQQELQELTAKMQQEFAQEQMQINQQLNDTITKALKEWNKDKNFQMIHNNIGGNSTILYCGDKFDYNVTQEVTEFLNEKYGKK